MRLADIQAFSPHQFSALSGRSHNSKAFATEELSKVSASVHDTVAVTYTHRITTSAHAYVLQSTGYQGRMSECPSSNAIEEVPKRRQPTPPHVKRINSRQGDNRVS